MTRPPPFAYQPKRVDRNQAQIVSAFRHLGCTVTPLHTVGSGLPDLVVGVDGITLLVEVKDGDKPPSARELTPKQKFWRFCWVGQACVVTSADEAIEVVKKARIQSSFLRDHGLNPDIQGSLEPMYTQRSLT